MHRATCAVVIAAALPLLVSAEAAAQELRFVAEGPDRAQIMLRESVRVHDPVDDRKHTRTEDLCRAPCSPQLSPGVHELGLQKGYDRGISWHSVVIPEGPATIQGKIISRRGFRIGLLVAGPTSMAAGHATNLASVLGTENPKLIGVGIGAALMALGVATYVTGLVLREGTSIEVLPGVSAAAGTNLPLAGPRAARLLSTPDAGGLTLRLRF